MASKKGEQVPWIRWRLFQRLIKPSWLRMCVISFQVRLNLRHPIGTEAPPISQCLGVPRCWSCHRLTKFAVHLGPLYLCSKKQSSSQLTAVKDSTYTFLSSNVWSLCSNMKVSLTLTSSTSVLFGRTCQDNLRFCFVTHLDVFRELNLYLKIWGVQTVQKFTVPAIK
jgi:hypothetical protein